MKYRVLQTIWSPSEQRTYGPGEEISLDHLSEEERASLVGWGLVEAMPEPGPDTPDVEPTSGIIDLADGVSDAEANLAGRALRGRHRVRT